MEHKTNKKPVRNGVARVPVMMQMEALECGAACLGMVLAYYGKWVSLEQLRTDCGVSRDGSSARNILIAARNYGMVVNGYKAEPEQLRANGAFPCIIHWEFNHFVVLDGFKGGKAYLNDPARGSCAVSMEDFDEGFTGVFLMMEPSEDFEPGGSRKSIFGFAASRLKGTGPAVVFVLLMSVISALADMINAGFSRFFMDQLLTGFQKDMLVPFIIGLSLISVIMVTASGIRDFFSVKIGGKMSAYSNASYMWKVLRLPMEFFSQRMAADIQVRQTENESISADLVGIVAPLLIQVGEMVFYLVVMIRYSWVLTLIGVTGVVVNFFISRYISEKKVNISRVMMRDSGKLSAASVSGIEMIETIKSSGSENGFFERWSGYQASVNTQMIKAMEIDQYMGLIPSVVSIIIDTMVLFCGVYLIIRGNFTLGMFMAMNGFLDSFMSPAEEIIGVSQTVQEMRTKMERVEDVMEYPVEVETGEELNADTEEGDEEDSASGKTGNETSGETGKTGKTYGKLTGSLSMKHVTFGYSPLAEPLIKDFSLELKSGASVAFVGSSGCGKSTLSKLISGLYDPWEGEILFDGVDRKHIDRNVFTGSVAVVDQDIILFEDTISNNIRMWDSSIQDFEVIMAARDADIHEDIMKRPGGYDYMVTEGGRDFSGGERQRIEIARVLAQDPTLVIMDEATSALDARTEYDVVRSIADRGISTIIIAHRLSTIRDCDEIIVLDRGNVVQRGTHEQLMKEGGMYRELITSE